MFLYVIYSFIYPLINLFIVNCVILPKSVFTFFPGRHCYEQDIEAEECEGGLRLHGVSGLCLCGHQVSGWIPQGTIRAGQPGL